MWGSFPEPALSAAEGAVRSSEGRYYGGKQTVTPAGEAMMYLCVYVRKEVSVLGVAYRALGEEGRPQRSQESHTAKPEVTAAASLPR